MSRTEFQHFMINCPDPILHEFSRFADENFVKFCQIRTGMAINQRN